MDTFFLIGHINQPWDVVFFLVMMVVIYVVAPVVLLVTAVEFLVLVVVWATGPTKSPSYPSVRRAPSGVVQLPWDEILAEPTPAAVRPRRVAIPVVATPVPVHAVPRGVV